MIMEHLNNRTLNKIYLLLIISLWAISCSNNSETPVSKDSKNELVDTNRLHEVTQDSANTTSSAASTPDSKTEKMDTQRTNQSSLGTDFNPSVQKSKPFDTDYLMGKFEPSTHPDFSTIATKHASNSGMRMRTDAYEAFQQMFAAAKKEGITLKIISATRPFHHQKSIWEAKWNGQRQVDGKLLPKDMEPKQKAMKILRWSSMPGTSRHHWGTDIDINNLNNSYFESGNGKKEYDWLVNNASAFGFCQVYSVIDATRPNGYQEEKWHWSYIPVARKLTALYKEKLSNGDIAGFSGSESAALIDVKTKYVLGINPRCD